jgi:isoquinoline 1-oxidoreductase alpha subunit
MVTIKVNGTSRQLDVESEMPLLWALREEIGLTGTKFGCGIAQCGACTVHVNGQAVRSCSVTLGSVDGAEIVTIEGLSPDSQHPVQQAWLTEQVPQCGYCQSGQLMSAAVLLREKSDPTDEDIDACMSGNVCRCGTYLRIRRAIQRAAGTIAPPAEPPKGGAR